MSIARPKSRNVVRRRSILLSAALVWLVFGSCRPDPPSQPRRPNIVLIVVDTLRASNVSFLGYSRDTTPHLDELASDSIVFEQAISVGGNTPTAMSALMTGRYPFVGFDEDWSPESAFGMRRFYVDSSESGLPRSLPTLAERLQAAGYETAGVITNPFLKPLYNFHRGFTTYREIFRTEGVPYGNSEAVAAAAIELLDSGIRQPFFLYLHYMDTHGPYSPPPPFRTRYQADERLEGYSELWRRWEKQIELESPESRELHALMLDLYDGAIAYVDDSIGQVVRELRRRGVFDETIVAVTADHGEEFLEHGGTTHKGTLYDELVRVPLLLRQPGKSGRRIASLVRTFDLYPTLLDFSGIDTSGESIDAVSLRPLIEDAVPSLGLAAYAGFPNVRMLRTQRYKLLHRKSGRKEFYDLIEDPGEQNDLYPGSAARPGQAAHHEGLARMEEKLAELEADLQAKRPIASPDGQQIDETTREQLQALGYLD